jgi:hypothetical protein
MYDTLNPYARHIKYSILNAEVSNKTQPEDNGAFKT